jgi:hypothetical protein
MLEANLSSVEKGISINNVAQSSSQSSLFSMSVSGTALCIANSLVLVAMGILKLLGNNKPTEKTDLIEFD